MYGRYNVKELFDNSVYETAAERKASGATKETSISLKHSFDDVTDAGMTRTALSPLFGRLPLNDGRVRAFLPRVALGRARTSTCS